MTQTDPNGSGLKEVTIPYQDQSLPCLDCADTFAFSASDQGLGEELGHEAPTRCRDCRVALEVTRYELGALASTAMTGDVA